MTPTSTPTPAATGSNDDIASATLISSFPFTATQDTTKATVASDDPNMGQGAGINSFTVWFRFVAPSSGGVRANSSGSDYDTVMAAFSGSRGNLTLLTSNDDAGTGYQSEVAFNVQAGTTYYLEVAAYDTGPAGQMNLAVQFGAAVSATSTPTIEPTWTPWPTDTPIPTATVGAAPANDDINSATLISAFPYSSSEDTTGATVASDDPSMGSNLGVNSNTVWYSLTPGSAGTVTADTFGSSYDTVLAAFTGQRGSLTLVAGNDDANSSTRQSQVTFGVQAGITYYLEVAQYGSAAGGQLTLNVNSSAGTIGTPTATAETTPSAIGTTTVPAAVTPSVLSQAPNRMVPADASYFSQTGFRVNLDPFWDYFLKRGGVRTFGYPVSREFTLEGYQVQFFQRAIMQLMPDGTVETMNLLQSGMMPYSRINGSTFPLPDPEMISSAPSPEDPDYAGKAIAFIQANVPDSWNGLQVNFLKSYVDTVRYEDAFPQGDGNPSLLPLFDMEMWGLPTSKPTYDPTNHDFVYQRFQRGILHYDAKTGATQALLLADYLKAIMTGKEIPPDLAVQITNNPFYLQYDPTKAYSLARPADLPNTDLSYAFEPELTVRVLLPAAPR